MTELQNPKPQPHLGKTFAACLLAAAVFVVAELVVGGAWFLLNSIVTFVRPAILAYMGMVIGTSVAMVLARVACDAWLKGYLPQVVFFMFALVSVAGAIFEFAILPLTLDRFASYAQVLLIPALAYSYFWKGAETA